MHPILALVLVLGGAYIALRLIDLVPHLIAWAANAIRSLWRGVRTGYLVLQRLAGQIRALAFGSDGELADEVEVDEQELPEEVLRALRRRSTVVETIDVEN